MNANDLKNINASTRKMILDYLTKSGKTLNAFAKECGVHQNQIWLYLYSNDPKKGLHTATLEKIGKYLLAQNKK